MSRHAADAAVETFLIRTLDGPMVGVWTTTSEVYTWPLPDVLPVPAHVGTGSYRKVSQSAADESVSPSFVRGAQYVWRED